MPAGGDPADEGRHGGSRLTWRQRLLLALPTVGLGKDRADRTDRPPLAERLRDAMVKPVGGEAPSKAAGRKSSRAEDIEAELRSADDNERLLGMLAAPCAAAIGFIVINVLIDRDPAPYLANHRPNPDHVSVTLYHNLELVLLGLSLLILLAAAFRKRLLLGIALAVYGLAVFNLHWWGFGIPFVLGGAWLMVRSYRLQRDWKDALAGAPPRGRPPGRAGSQGSGPRASKRYTPPTPPRRSPPSKPENHKRAG